MDTRQIRFEGIMQPRNITHIRKRTESDDKSMNEQEAAHWLMAQEKRRVTVQDVRELERAQLIPYRTIGGRVVFSLHDLRRWRNEVANITEPQNTLKVMRRITATINVRRAVEDSKRVLR